MSYSGKFKDKNNNLHPVTSVLYGTCDTAAATAAKVVTCTDFDTLMTGVTIRVKFANANTAASPTVNINSTGEKSVYRFGSTAPVDGNSWNAGEVVELVYDGTSFFMTGADDIAAKQNATDNSLDTDAKTIVGAINENAGDISTLKSGLTTLDSEVNGDATVYPYADVITIEDAVPANVADCSVKIELVQDLHGQSAPYVGGAGRQKLPLDLATLKTLNTSGTWADNVYTLNDVTATCNLDDGGNVVSIKTNGTASATFFFLLGNFADILTSGTSYIINSNIYPASDSAYLQIRKANDAGYLSLTEEYSFEYTSDGNVQKFGIRVDTAATANNVVLTPMLRLATETDATFAPYTNLCPITGHTEASVQDEGTQLVPNGTDTSNGYKDNYYLTSNGVEITGGDTYISEYFDVVANVSYILKDRMKNANAASVCFYNANKQYISGYAVNKETKIITTPSNAVYARCTQIKNLIENEIYFKRANQYTIALGDTIYGGTVDFDTGVMKPMWASEVFDGTQTVQNVTRIDNVVRGQFVIQNSATYPYAISNYLEWVNDWGLDQPHFYIYDNKINVFLPIPNDGTSTWDSYLASNPLQVVYPLATPTTIQLTPQQIQLLKGQNTLTASTGQISVTVNGVSGSIGQLTEDVAELDSELTTFEGRFKVIDFNLPSDMSTKSVGDNVNIPVSGLSVSGYYPLAIVTYVSSQQRCLNGKFTQFGADGSAVYLINLLSTFSASYDGLACKMIMFKA